MTILLAEDSALYRHLITSRLVEWGFDFVCAKDGREAWDLLAKPDAPRLALLDWVLPGVDGVELCRRLRQPPETERIPIRSYSRLRVRSTRCSKQWPLARMTSRKTV